jgi:chromosome segregation ATPase
MKENFEDLLAALKEELEASRNERDNLRDEVVPQLRARVEGLEAEASDLQKLMYEHSRMQQELESLKNENATLAAAIREKSQMEIQSPVQIQGAEQARVLQPQLVQIHTGVGNRQSLASRFATPGTPTDGVPTVSLPLNAKDRESLAERLKDVELQRDSLHKALKLLRDRQQLEAKKSKDRIKALEQERDRALHPTIKRQGRDKEMSALRREVDRLRQRADDALEQKFVCERSLGTLKMDLEKAAQETSTLRVLLQEHDDLIAQHEELQESHQRLSREVSELKQGEVKASQSVSLQQAYKDLQNLHERSLARLEELENRPADPSYVSERERALSEANEESQRAIQELRKSLTTAEVDRDSAKVEAEAYRKRAESLQRSETLHLQEERNLAAQLRISSERVEELAAQVRAQLASNENLRERLAECIERGEQEQRASAKKINDLQDKLRQLEDKVLEAQQQAEEAVAQREDEIRRIKETHTSQLRRLKASAAPPKSPGFKPPLSPLLRSPRLEWTSIRRLSNSDSAKTEALEKRVSELERALSDADDEMAEVVNRMNSAQIEVLELQTER